MKPEQGTVLRLHGELDEEGCAAVRRQLAPQLAGGLQHLVLDFAEVTGLGKDGVQMLQSLDRFLKRRQGGLVVVNADAHVCGRLRVFELDHLLQVRDLDATRPRVPQAVPTVPDRRAGVVPLARRA